MFTVLPGASPQPARRGPERPADLPRVRRLMTRSRERQRSRPIHPRLVERAVGGYGGSSPRATAALPLPGLRGNSGYASAESESAAAARAWRLVARAAKRRVASMLAPATTAHPRASSTPTFGSAGSVGGCLPVARVQPIVSSFRTRYTAPVVASAATSFWFGLPFLDPLAIISPRPRCCQFPSTFVP